MLKFPQSPASWSMMVVKGGIMNEVYPKKGKKNNIKFSVIAGMFFWPGMMEDDSSWGSDLPNPVGGAARTLNCSLFKIDAKISA